MTGQSGYKKMTNGIVRIGCLVTVLTVSFARAAAEIPNVAARQSVSDVLRRAESGENLTVVWFGGSLTWGANATDPNLTSFRGRMNERFLKNYPKAHWTFVDSAIGGVGSQMAVFRVDRDVVSKNPDLVFVDFSVNDGLDASGDLASESAEGAVRRILERTKAAVVPVIMPLRKYVVEPNEQALRRRTEHLALARHYGLPVGDVLGEMRAMNAAGKLNLDEVWLKEFGDNSHPYDSGYALYADIVWRQVIAHPSSARLAELPPPIGRNVYGKVCRASLRSAAKLPRGWRTTVPYLRAGSFDFSCSRWMDSMTVAANCRPKAYTDYELTGETPEPLKLRFKGAVVALMGESMENSGSVEIRIDGKQVGEGPWDTKGMMAWGFAPSAYWFQTVESKLNPEDWHTLELLPHLKEGCPEQVRLESICAAGPNEAQVMFGLSEGQR